MKTRFSTTFTIAVIIFSSFPLLGQKAAIQAGDLSRLIGDWQGSLTYLNYQDNQYVTIRTNLQIVAGENENEIKVTNSYPDEPNAGGSYRLWTKKNGTRLNKELVTAREALEDGTIEIVTTYRGAMTISAPQFELRTALEKTTTLPARTYSIRAKQSGSKEMSFLMKEASSL